jgi:uncharacterized membrane protein YphA (DoxX/SURF4 family)
MKSEVRRSKSDIPTMQGPKFTVQSRESEPQNQGPNRPGSRRSKALEAGAVVVRWLLGLLFVYMGLNKALHPDLFLKLARQYDLTNNPYFLNVIAAGLPWFEVFCGLLLLAGVAVRGAALMLLLMLLAFTPLVLQRALALAAANPLVRTVTNPEAAVLQRALTLAAPKAPLLCLVKFDCGCGTGEVFACNKLVENCLLIAFSAWLLTGRGRRFCVWFSLFEKHH